MRTARTFSGAAPRAARSRMMPGTAPTTAASGNPRSAASAPCPARGILPPRLSIAARIAKCLRTAGSGWKRSKSRECLPSGRWPRNSGSRASSAKPYPGFVRSVERRNSAAAAPAAAMAPADVPPMLRNRYCVDKRATAVGKTMPDVMPPFMTRSQNLRPASPRSIALFAMMFSAAHQDPDVPGAPFGGPGGRRQTTRLTKVIPIAVCSQPHE